MRINAIIALLIAIMIAASTVSMLFAPLVPPSQEVQPLKAEAFRHEELGELYRIQIRGTVTDRDTGRPIGGALIKVTYQDAEIDQLVTTESARDGGYVISFAVSQGSLAAGHLPYQIKVDAPAGVIAGEKRYDQFTSNRRLLDVTDGSRYTLDTALVHIPGMEVRGRITDENTNRLLDGAMVKVTLQDERGRDRSIVDYSRDFPIDSRGNNYAIFLPSFLPRNVLLSVDGGQGYIPKSSNIRIDPSLEQKGNYWRINFPLTPASGNAIVVDDRLHHLGDDAYGVSKAKLCRRRS